MLIDLGVGGRCELRIIRGFGGIARGCGCQDVRLVVGEMMCMNEIRGCDEMGCVGNGRVA